MYKRYVLLIVLFIFRCILAGILIGTLYYNLDTGYDSKAYTNRLSVSFLTTLTLFAPHLSDMTELQKDRNLFYRERSCHAYSPFAYWISRLLFSLPFDILGIILKSFLIYYLCGLRYWETGGGSYFLYFITTSYLTDVTSHVLCQIISNISPSMQVASSFFPIAIAVFAAFEGYLIFLPNFPNWISWVAYFNYLRYAFQGLVLNEFSGNGDLPLSSTYVHNLGFESLDKGKVLVILLVFLLLMSIVSYLTLFYIRFERR